MDKAESGTVEVSLDGVELHNSTLVVVMHECKCEKLQEYAPQHQQYPTRFIPDLSLNSTYRCGDHSSNKNANNENSSCILNPERKKQYFFLFIVYTTAVLLEFLG